MVDEVQARQTAFHILNLFNIPQGVVRTPEDGQMWYDYTQWTSVSDLRNKRYFVHTYDNRQVRMIDLMNMDLNAKEPVIIALKSKETVTDITPKK